MDVHAGVSKARIRADLASRRSALLLQLVGFTEETLSTAAIVEDLTAQDLLLLAARGDEGAADAVTRCMAGHDAEDPAMDVSHDADQKRDAESIDTVLSRFLRARAAFLSALARVEESELVSSVSGSRTIAELAHECADRDARVADALAEWRATARPAQSTGPKSVLIAALRAARKELLTTLALIPADERETYLVAGQEPLGEILSRTEGWEAELLRKLTHAPTKSIDAPINDSTAEVPEREPWASTWSRLHSTHQRLLRALDGVASDSLSRLTQDGGRAEQSVYQSVISIMVHDHHQAARLRQSIEMDHPGSRAVR